MTKIVVIEDEFDIRAEVMDWLQFEGYEVIGAENGRLGLQTIHQEKPALVLCDISMPEMDGQELLVELRSDAAFAQLPFIFLTAAADRDSMRQSMNLGADDYLTKPFSQADVITAVRTRLGKQKQIQSQIDQLGNLIEAERQQRLLKSRLVGMFSHDFRNPLASILASSNILQNYADRLKPEQRQKHLNRIDGSAHMLMQMLDEMLMVAEIESGQLSRNPQPTDCRKLIEKIVGDFQLIDEEKHQITTSIQLPDSLSVDPKLMQHIVTNLVSNALKYSPDGSEVHVQAAVVEGSFVFAIQDTGIGIPAEDRARIFEPFFRAENAHKAKGTGLGLALVKQAVDICGGMIEVDSEVGRGTLFTVKIPLH